MFPIMSLGSTTRTRYGRYEWEQYFQKQKITWKYRRAFFSLVVPATFFLSFIFFGAFVAGELFSDGENITLTHAVVVSLFFTYILTWLQFVSYILSLTPHQLFTVLPRSRIYHPYKFAVGRLAVRATIVAMICWLILTVSFITLTITLLLFLVITHILLFTVPVYARYQWIKRNQPQTTTELILKKYKTRSSV